MCVCLSLASSSSGTIELEVFIIKLGMMTASDMRIHNVLSILTYVVFFVLCNCVPSTVSFFVMGSAHLMNFVVCVCVQDGKGAVVQLTSSIGIRIVVEDSQDTDPIFTNQNLQFSVLEGSAVVSIDNNEHL